MITRNTQFETELTRLINEEIESLKVTIAGGMISDLAEYKRLTGMIKGLLRAIELCEEVNTILDKR